jgi:integrase/recombinase XerD
MNINWEEAIEGFRIFLKLEKSLSTNSIEAYLRDVEKLKLYATAELGIQTPLFLDFKKLSSFLIYLGNFGFTATSQARIICGIRAFYKYLLVDDLLQVDPTELLESPKLTRHLPDILNIQEIESIIDNIDMSLPNANRDKAIIEILYGCGLRVSELVNLKLSQIYVDDEFLKVVGKGNKERLVPLGSPALKAIQHYMASDRMHVKVQTGFEDFLFLNNRGKNYSRVMIFLIIKQRVSNAGIRKVISPHTFRHSFASHMVEGGADLRAVQEMLGHESILTTEIYTHVDSSLLRESIVQFHPRGRL